MTFTVHRQKDLRRTLKDWCPHPGAAAIIDGIASRPSNLSGSRTVRVTRLRGLRHVRFVAVTSVLLRWKDRRIGIVPRIISEVVRIDWRNYRVIGRSFGGVRRSSNGSERSSGSAGNKYIVIYINCELILIIKGLKGQQFPNGLNI